MVITEHEIIGWVGNELSRTAFDPLMNVIDLTNPSVFISRHGGLVLGDEPDALGDTSLWKDEEPDMMLNIIRTVETRCEESGCVCPVATCTTSTG